MSLIFLLIVVLHLKRPCPTYLGIHPAVQAAKSVRGIVATPFRTAPPNTLNIPIVLQAAVAFISLSSISLPRIRL